MMFNLDKGLGDPLEVGPPMFSNRSEIRVSKNLVSNKFQIIGTDFGLIRQFDACEDQLHACA